MRIDGYFNASGEPVISLDCGSLSIETLIDTGFGGSLFMPGQVARRLDLENQFAVEEFCAANGETFLADVYSMEFDWLGKRIRVPVMTSPKVDQALLGSHMLRDCCLTIDYGNRTVAIIASQLR